jgi:hypothetical protein
VAADCVTLWIGDSLGPVERACMRSVLRQGHQMALYCYSEPEGVPAGVELRDAAEILPEAAIVRHESGSIAIFADWFRYELQRRGLGTWVDADNYLVAPLDMERPYLFGRQIVTPDRPWRRRQRTSIAIGVLRLPADSPMLAGLLGQFDGRSAPDWLSWTSNLRGKIQKRLRGRSDVSRLPWGATGPFAITALAERHGLASQALSVEAFNPAPWYEARWILDPAITLDHVVTERTVGVHLWNECIKGFKNGRAPSGSFLERLHREGA